MKPLLLAAAAALLFAPAAQAQVAAGTVPNTFDDPAARSPVAARPATGPIAAVPAPAHPDSEDLLRAIIAGAQAGTIDYALMTDDLAGKVREQEATVTPMIQGFGPLVSASFADSQSGSDLYSVIFANAATQWVIGVNEAGKVAVLLFRPAPD